MQDGEPHGRSVSPRRRPPQSSLPRSLSSSSGPSPATPPISDDALPIVDVKMTDVRSTASSSSRVAGPSGRIAIDLTQDSSPNKTSPEDLVGSARPRDARVEVRKPDRRLAVPKSIPIVDLSQDSSDELDVKQKSKESKSKSKFQSKNTVRLPTPGTPSTGLSTSVDALRRQKTVAKPAYKEKMDAKATAARSILVEGMEARGALYAAQTATLVALAQNVDQFASHADCVEEITRQANLFNEHPPLDSTPGSFLAYLKSSDGNLHARFLVAALAGGAGFDIKDSQWSDLLLHLGTGTTRIQRFDEGENRYRPYIRVTSATAAVQLDRSTTYSSTYLHQADREYPLQQALAALDQKKITHRGYTGMASTKPTGWIEL